MSGFHGWALAGGLLGVFVAALGGMLLLLTAVNGGWDGSLAERPLTFITTTLVCAWFAVLVLHFRHLPPVVDEAEYSARSPEGQRAGPAPRRLPRPPLWLHTALAAMLLTVLLALAAIRLAS